MRVFSFIFPLFWLKNKICADAMIKHPAQNRTNGLSNLSSFIISKKPTLFIIFCWNEKKAEKNFELIIVAKKREKLPKNNLSKLILEWQVQR